MVRSTRTRPGSSGPVRAAWFFRWSNVADDGEQALLETKTLPEPGQEGYGDELARRGIVARGRIELPTFGL